MKNNKHNKKRNIGIIYELLLRHMSNALIEGNKRQIKKATELIEKRFNKSSEIYKEFRVFTALSKANINSTERAAALLSESKLSCQNINQKRLEKEKSYLIKDINYKIAKNDKSFYYRSIPEYKAYANIQSAINEWKKGDRSNLRQLIELEEKLIKFIIKEKNIITLSEEKQKMERSESNQLVYKIMSNKINEKYKDMTSDQKYILNEYALCDGNYDKLKLMLENIKEGCINKINKFKSNNNNQYLSNQVNKVFEKINKLDVSIVDDNNIVKFLTVTKLIKEFDNPGE